MMEAYDIDPTNPKQFNRWNFLFKKTNETTMTLHHYNIREAIFEPATVESHAQQERQLEIIITWAKTGWYASVFALLTGLLLWNPSPAFACSHADLLYLALVVLLMGPLRDDCPPLLQSYKWAVFVVVWLGLWVLASSPELTATPPRAWQWLIF